MSIAGLLIGVKTKDKNILNKIRRYIQENNDLSLEYTLCNDDEDYTDMPTLEELCNKFEPLTTRFRKIKFGLFFYGDDWDEEIGYIIVQNENIIKNKENLYNSFSEKLKIRLDIATSEDKIDELIKDLVEDKKEERRIAKKKKRDEDSDEDSDEDYDSAEDDDSEYEDYSTSSKEEKIEAYLDEEYPDSEPEDIIKYYDDGNDGNDFKSSILEYYMKKHNMTNISNYFTS